jgi:hypothetical protein
LGFNALFRIIVFPALVSMRPVLSRRRLQKIYRAVLAARRNPRFRGKSKRAVALCVVASQMPWIERACRHFALVTRHKFYVFIYCAYAGHPWRGFMHDWSKYSPAEFFASVKYFNGRRSPVGLCREIEGYSFAWLHHKGRNRHHFEFWTDVIDAFGTAAPKYGQWYPIAMPYEYALESICDTIAASRAYNGRNFSYEILYQWWQRRQRVPVNMHPETKRFADAMYEAMRKDGNCSALKRAREIFEQAKKEQRSYEQAKKEQRSLDEIPANA